MTEIELIALQTRLAYQEATLRDLNDVITRQQTRLDRLERICRDLAERALRAPDLAKGSLEDEVPPHY